MTNKIQIATDTKKTTLTSDCAITLTGTLDNLDLDLQDGQEVSIKYERYCPELKRWITTYGKATAKEATND